MNTSNKNLEKSSIQVTNKNSPLANFPRGAIGGDCLHKILEKIDFTKQTKSKETNQVIKDELLNSGLSTEFINPIEEGLNNLLNTRLGGPLKDFQLRTLKQNGRISELNFDLPIAPNGKKVISSDIAQAFLKNRNSLFSEQYFKRLQELSFISRGFFTGSIDLIFPDETNLNKARWWVIDWKSNWIGKKDQDGNVLTCGAMDYTQKAMFDQMIMHHYPLQATLYLVALHRFLKWRLPNYNPKQNLGGYAYIFLRGIPNIENTINSLDSSFTSGVMIEEAPLERLFFVDEILRKGGK